MKLSPLSHTVAQAIKHAILNREYEVNRPLPSERVLSDRHSVSRTVVREAVASLAAEGWLHMQERCRPVVASRGFSVKAQRSGHVGVWLWPYVDDYMASAIFQGIRSVLSGSDHRLFVSSGGSEPWEETLRREAAFLREVAEDPQGVGAILWYLGGSQNVDALRECQRAGRHLVFVDRLPPAGIECDFVGTDNLGVSRKVVNQLIQMGHKRIAFVSNLDRVSSVHEREEGYRRALSSAGIEVLDEYLMRVGSIGGGDSELGGLSVVTRLMEMSPRPTAVVAVNDNVAIQLMRALQHLGLSAPEDISLVSFDGLLRWVPGGDSVASVAQDFFRMGEVASDLLLRRAHGESDAPYRHVLLDAPLSLNNSVAPLVSRPDPLVPGSPFKGLGQ